MLPTDWPIIVAVDETLERRRGKKIKAKGAYRDAVASSQSRVVISFGLKWECMTLTVKWYGSEQRTIECLSFECLWYHAGELPLKLRIVLIKTPNGKNEAETFFSTDLANSPTQIIEWFVLRWNIEICQSYYLHKNKVNINLPFLPVNDNAILADDFLKPLAA